jgi:hypothetical protein
VTKIDHGFLKLKTLGDCIISRYSDAMADSSIYSVLNEFYKLLKSSAASALNGDWAIWAFSLPF